MTIPAPPHDNSPAAHPADNSPAARLTRVLVPAVLAGVLGVLAAVLMSCGSSGAGLIPVGNAGPLQSDFEAIAAAAQSGNGSCEATEAAIQKTKQDFSALPGNVDSGLRDRLREGISNLSEKALAACKQPLPQATVTSNSTTSTDTTPSTTTPTTTTDTTPTSTTPPATTPAPTTTGQEGGTPAPKEGAAPGGQGGTEPGAGSGGAGAGGQEGGK